MSKKYVSNRGIGGIKDNAGTGFVIIPANTSISQFIKQCFTTGTVSIILENGGVIDNVLITKAALKDIDFPDDSTATGTQVVWINQPRKNQPIAIGCISKTNEFVNFSKNKSDLRKATKNFVSEVIVDAEKGCVIINSNSSLESGGDIYIVSVNKNKTSKLNVNVSGDINLISTNLSSKQSNKISVTIKGDSKEDKETTIVYEKGKGLSYKDEFENIFTIDKNSITQNAKKNVILGKGKEPLLLGTTTVNLLNELITAIIAITVTTVMGASPINNSAQFTELLAKLEELKSKYSSTD